MLALENKFIILIVGNLLKKNVHWTTKLIIFLLFSITFLLIFGFWGKEIFSLAQPVLRGIKNNFRLIMGIIFVALAIFLFFKGKKIEVFLHKYTPTIVLWIIFTYMIGWFFTFSYTSTSYLPLMNDGRLYTKVDEYVYLFDGTMNFFIAIAAFLSLYSLTLDRKKERLNQRN